MVLAVGRPDTPKEADSSASSGSKYDLWGQTESKESRGWGAGGSEYLKGHLLTCLLRLIARHEQEIPNWKMKTKPRMIMY